MMMTGLQIASASLACQSITIWLQMFFINKQKKRKLGKMWIKEKGGKRMRKEVKGYQIY